MMRSGTLRTAILAVVGLCLAVAVGLAANAISRDSIGLAPAPVGSGVRLAPSKTTSTEPARKATPAKKESTTAKQPNPSTGTTTTTPTTTSGGDDNGGNRGRGGGSGSGSSGGSGGGGHGGDD